MSIRRLIVVDGLDGCGKDTHAQRIKALLESRRERVYVISHPSKRLFGKLSKRFLEGEGHAARFLATVFFTADVLASVSRFNAQREGTTIFVRYLMGTAYLPRRLAPAGYVFFRKLLPFPDLALFIDIDPEVAIRRIERRDHKREMFETLDRLAKVRSTARKLVSHEWYIVDNSQDGEQSFAEVETLLKDRGMI